MVTIGLMAAILAMLSWTIGDYSIDKTTERVGDWKTMFFIGLGSFVGLTVFIWPQILEVFNNPPQFSSLLFLSIFSVLAVLLMFEGLKIGKLSIIEPIFGIELPTTIALSIIIGGEHLSPIIYLLSALVFIGILLAATIHDHINWKKIILEKGAILAGIGAVGMGGMNFMIGILSRSGSPLVTIWFLHTFIGLAALIYILFMGKGRTVFQDLKNHTKYILSTSVFDNLGWISFAYAAVILPISIVTTIGSGYVALTVLLGVFLNKEKIQRHQIAGVVMVIIGILSLSYLVEY